MKPLSTLRRCWYTPRGVTPALFLISCRCGSSNIQKQSVSNAFQYVVHRPRGSSLLKEYHSQWGNSFCKSTKKKQLKQLFRNFFFFFFCTRLLASVSFSQMAKWRWHPSPLTQIFGNGFAEKGWEPVRGRLDPSLTPHWPLTHHFKTNKKCKGS